MLLRPDTRSAKIACHKGLEPPQAESRDFQICKSPADELRLSEPDEAMESGGICDAMITLHRAKVEDDSFLYAVFASTRMEEMALTDWDPATQEQFLRMQFAAQTTSYKMQFPNADHWVIRCEAVPVGRMILGHDTSEIRLIDIALLPQHRHRKIGTRLLQRLLNETENANNSIRLHVERFNPALRWYEKLGFKTVNVGPIYLEMVHSPVLSGTAR